MHPKTIFGILTPCWFPYKCTSHTWLTCMLFAVYCENEDALLSRFFLSGFAGWSINWQLQKIAVFTSADVFILCKKTWVCLEHAIKVHIRKLASWLHLLCFTKLHSRPGTCLNCMFVHLFLSYTQKRLLVWCWGLTWRSLFLSSLCRWQYMFRHPSEPLEPHIRCLVHTHIHSGWLTAFTRTFGAFPLQF